MFEAGDKVRITNESASLDVVITQMEIRKPYNGLLEVSGCFAGTDGFYHNITVYPNELLNAKQIDLRKNYTIQELLTEINRRLDVEDSDAITN